MGWESAGVMSIGSGWSSLGVSGGSGWKSLKEETTPGFSPSDISGLRLWYKADSLGLSDGDSVETWADLSGNARTLTSVSSPTFRQNILNGHPVVRFVPNDVMAATAPISFRTAIAVVKYNAPTFADFSGLLTGTGTEGGDLVFVGHNGGTKWYDQGLGVTYRKSGGEIINPMAAPMEEFAIVQISLGGVGWTITPQVGNDRIYSPRFWNGDVAEIICYETVLSLKNLEYVGSYLADKYNLPWTSTWDIDWRPTDLTDLELWLNSDGLSGSVGDPISTWLETSGHGRHLFQANSVRKPTIALDRFGTGLGARFESPDHTAGMSQWLEFPNFLGGFTEGEVFLVFKIDFDPPVSDSGSGLWGIGSQFGENVHVPYVDGNIYESFGSMNRKFCGNPSLSLADDYRVYNISSKAGEWIIRINGAVLYSTASNVVGWRDGGGFEGPALLGAMNTAPWLQGNIDEMALFSRVLESEERELMTIYLS